MPTTVTVNDVSGVTPVYIYLCDNPITTCVYIGDTSSFPYSFNIPLPFDGQSSYNIKVIDNDGCTKIETLTI